MKDLVFVEICLAINVPYFMGKLRFKRFQRCNVITLNGTERFLASIVILLLGFQVPVPSDEEFLHSNPLEDLLSTSEPSELALDHCETPAELQEHRYCLPAPDPDSRDVHTGTEDNRRKTVIEPSFTAYNQIAR